MNEELGGLLESDYRQEVEAQTADYAEAEESRQSGAMADYFDLMTHVNLPDTCWALEKWDEAKRVYRENARVMTEARAWHAKHSGPNYPLEERSDLAAANVVKAGDLTAGREHLKRAVAYRLTRKPNALVLSMLGLHAAQAGLPELAAHAKSVVTARQELPGGEGAEAGRARELLHYEPAQVNLLLGGWDEFQENVKAFEEGAKLVEGNPGLAFPEPLQQALVAASRGMAALAGLRAGASESKAARDAAGAAFEEAMLGFYKFGGGVDWNLYFMRLNTRLADDLAAGREPNPNPFADGWSIEAKPD